MTVPLRILFIVVSIMQVTFILDLILIYFWHFLRGVNANGALYIVTPKLESLLESVGYSRYDMGEE